MSEIPLQGLRLAGWRRDSSQSAAERFFFYGYIGNENQELAS
jgi:hypothetical protein